jgi:two-component system OmpR family response regulator
MLVDDTPEILVLCAEILKDNYEIVGTAPDGKSAIAACRTTAPDVVVLDIFMPRLSGIEVAKRLRSTGCQAVIVFLSDDTESVMAALDAGGSAFVTKARLGSDLVVAIAEALSGRGFVSEMP